VLNSIVEAAGLMKFNVRIGVPEGYESDAGFIARAQAGGARLASPRRRRSRAARMWW
jgi:ornithine carbamoyltransferase